MMINTQAKFGSLTNWLAIALLSISCAHTPQIYEGRLVDESVDPNNGICYRVESEFRSKDPDPLKICTDQYPSITTDDKAKIVSKDGKVVGFQVYKLASFEKYLELERDLGRIGYQTFVYFDNKKQIDHERYEKQWRTECSEKGLSCRLLAYSLKVRGMKNEFLPLMRKGCSKKDLISCFNLVVYDESLTPAEQLKLKISIRPTCEAVKKDLAYHDFCGVISQEQYWKPIK